MYATDRKTIDRMKENFRDLRKIYGLSEKDLGRFLGVTPAAIENHSRIDRSWSTSLYIAYRYIFEDVGNDRMMVGEYGWVLQKVMELLVDDPEDTEEKKYRRNQIREIVQECGGKTRIPYARLRNSGAVIRRRIAEEVYGI